MEGLTTKAYEDSNFVAGDSPVVHDFHTDVGWGASYVRIACDGAGSILVAFSTDGVYGNNHTIKSGEVVSVGNVSGATPFFTKVRVTHSGADSSYRILMY